MSNATDAVNHPAHYEQNRINGYECIQVTRHFTFSSGNAIKYCWRTGYKADDMQDLDKADFYIKDAMDNRPVEGTSATQVALSMLSNPLFKSDTRVTLVTELTYCMAIGDYLKALQKVEALREFVKENVNA